MLFREIDVLNENYIIDDKMYVGVEDDRIEYIGKEMPDKDFGEEYDGKNRLLMAGFYNLHAHSPMSLMRGYGENMVLQDWLTKKIFPFEDKLSGDAVYWATMLAMAESIRFGIVSSSDMYYFTSDMVRAVADSGAKNNISRSITNFTGDDFEKLPGAVELFDAVRQFNGYADGRVIIESSLHAEYTSDEKTAKALAEYTRSSGLGMHVHVSETKAEHEECKERHGGMTPAAYLNSCGIFDVRTVAAHCVWCDGDDFDILKDKGVSVASNPCSNLKLASGVCDVPKMMDMGINVGIGTDSVASNNSLNFMEEMKIFSILAKGKSGDPTIVTPAQVLAAATENGAKAQGRSDCGRIKVGNKADITVIRTDTANMQPVHSLLNNVVYSASGNDVVLTMADGKVLYRDGEYTTIDIEKTIYETNKATAEILKQL